MCRILYLEIFHIQYHLKLKKVKVSYLYSAFPQIFHRVKGDLQ